MDLKKILNDVKNGSMNIDDAFNVLKQMPYEDLGYAKVDHHRKTRTGFCEVVYCEGKTIPQIEGIAKALADKTNETILLTRASKEVFEAIYNMGLKAEYFDLPRIVVLNGMPDKCTDSCVAVLSAGTADLGVAEEAAIVLEATGNKVDRIYDVGVSGIHRLLSKRDRLERARVLIVVAGMEGALASVVGGLTDKPVIAVPTSVGYGANFGGLSALLTMLNSCAAGVGVVNIDNGFGAGMLANLINKI